MNKKKKTLAPAPPIHPLTLFSTENLTLSDHLKSNKRQGSVLEVLEEKVLLILFSFKYFSIKM